MKKVAILFNENYYNMHSDWDKIIKDRFAQKNFVMDFVVIPVSSKNVTASLNKIPSDVDGIFVTPMFNLSQDQRKEM